MFSLNKLLQKVEVSTYTRFSRMRYLQLEAISMLLTEKFSAKRLITTCANMYIKATKVVNLGLIEVEVLEQ